MSTLSFDVAVIGCGSVGIATAYYLLRRHRLSRIALIDRGLPMAFTSAQSGDNYRNWWPHPTMVDLTDRTIDLMEDIARESGNRISMNRRGYVLSTRESDIDTLVDQLRLGFGDKAETLLRYHDDAEAPTYRRPVRLDWEGVPPGVDILRNRDLIRATFPSYAPDLATIIHIRRGGDISGQQLGMVMLEHLKEHGTRRLVGSVAAIHRTDSYKLELRTETGPVTVTAGKIVNAAGPFASDIAAMLDVDLPIHNVFQQKIAFDDREKAIPRNMPFSIDLDPQKIDWSEDERAILLEDPDVRWLAEDMPGAIHCRPDGGDGGSWIKLGWAYNDRPAKATLEPPLDDNFPEIVLRGALRLNPALKTYYGRLPRSMHHYGGWYTMTNENWPLIGPMGPAGAFMNCALSGFGTMAACASGELCAAWVADADLPPYARHLSLERYDDQVLMTELQTANKGIL